MRRYPVWNVVCDDPYDSLIDDLLAGRGLTRAELQVGPESLHPPEQMQDMAAAVERLERAVRTREKIVVYGDYDVDGVCSTTVLMDFLERVGADCDCLLPRSPQGRIRSQAARGRTRHSKGRARHRPG